MKELLIATNNAGKMKEFASLLADLPVKLLSLSDVGITSEINETGQTFDENAVLKACGYAGLAGLPALADDSGLVVGALGGRPGVHSARYAGPNASDSDRIEKLLSELGDVSKADGAARFVCAAAFADSAGNVIAETSGVCYGTIAEGPRGLSGFGYDPIFLLKGSDKTLAELDADTKNRISHRANAVAKIIPFLRGFFDI